MSSLIQPIISHFDNRLYATAVGLAATALAGRSVYAMGIVAQRAISSVINVVSHPTDGAVWKKEGLDLKVAINPWDKQRQGENAPTIKELVTSFGLNNPDKLFGSSLVKAAVVSGVLAMVVHSVRISAFSVPLDNFSIIGKFSPLALQTGHTAPIKWALGMLGVGG